MRRHPIVLSLCLCLAAGPAGAQGFFHQPPQPQPPARPAQPQCRSRRRRDRASRNSRPARPAAGAAARRASAGENNARPYDRDLQRLSEILGSLHFLRGICGSNEGQKWRNEAQALIEAEAPAGERHNQMVASFNRGYRAFQQSYRTCTPAANFAIRRYLDEGAKIARDITARYAN